MSEKTLTIKPIFLPKKTKGSVGLDIELNFELKDFDTAVGYNKPKTAPIIDAKTDADAIFSFLREYFSQSPETVRAYSKEIERLLLWCKHIAHSNISNLKRDDLIEYQKFLKAPSPKTAWVGAKVSRTLKDGSLNPAWRPFFGPLADTSVRKAMKILDSFFNYLVQANYLIGNPLAIDRRRKKRDNAQRRIIERYLELDEIQATLNALDQYPAVTEQDQYKIARARYVILLLFYTGLRISEASQHTMGHFLQREKCWYLSIIGKGDKPRDIPIPDALLHALKVFRLATGLSSPLPLYGEKIPLIPNMDHQSPITARRIDQILHFAFEVGAHYLEAKNQLHKASKLKQASAHWLRHSYVTYLLKSGASLKVAKENAGHSDVSTTMLYTHIANTDRYEATKSLSLNEKKDRRSRFHSILDP